MWLCVIQFVFLPTGYWWNSFFVVIIIYYSTNFPRKVISLSWLSWWRTFCIKAFTLNTMDLPCYFQVCDLSDGVQTKGSAGHTSLQTCLSCWLWKQMAKYQQSNQLNSFKTISLNPSFHIYQIVESFTNVSGLPNLLHRSGDQYIKAVKQITSILFFFLVKALSLSVFIIESYISCSLCYIREIV